MAYVFGVGDIFVSASAGTFSIGKLQNVSLNISYENAQLRGGPDVFPVDSQFFNGSIEGTFEWADIILSQLASIFAEEAGYTGAGASGTWTMTGLDKPTRFKLKLSGTTDGVTSTITLHRVFCPSLSLDFSRTDYTMPGANFICEAGTTGLATWNM